MFAIIPSEKVAEYHGLTSAKLIKKASIIGKIKINKKNTKTAELVGPLIIELKKNAKLIIIVVTNNEKTTET